MFAFFVLRLGIGQQILSVAGKWVKKSAWIILSSAPNLFLGRLARKSSSIGFIFAFQVLPTIIFIAAFFALLYYLGVMQVIIRVAAWVMQRVMGASGAESLNVAASIFMGQTEAPLTIRPFLPDLTRSELMTVMTSGMAHVSGGIMAAYIAFGVEAKHLLAAVIMTAPGTLLMAKMMVPETEVRADRGQGYHARNRRSTRTIIFWRDCARHHGRLESGHQRGGHADFISRADCAHQWNHGRHSQLVSPTEWHGFPSSLQADFRLDFRANCVGHRHAVARLPAPSVICLASAWCSTNWWRFHSLGR